MPWVSGLIGAGVGLWGQNQQQGAINAANQAQQQAMQQSLAQQQRQYDLYQQNMAPWMQAGRSALSAQQALMGLGGDTAGQMAALASSPGYQFRLQQGQNSLDSGLAARGGMGSGRALQAGVDYNQNFASNEYGNRLAQLAGLSGAGQSTAQNLGNMGMNFAQNYGNTLQGGANAMGAAGMAGANATQSSVLGGANLGLGLYNAFRPQRQQQPFQPNTAANWATNPNPNYSGPGINWPY